MSKIGNKTIFDEILDDIPGFEKKYVKKKCNIAVQISNILHERGMSQKELADELRVTEARLSKILSGSANLTLKSIAKLEVVLGEDIIQVPMFAEKKTEKVYVVMSGNRKKFSFRKTDNLTKYLLESGKDIKKETVVSDDLKPYKFNKLNNYG